MPEQPQRQVVVTMSRAEAEAVLAELDAVAAKRVWAGPTGELPATLTELRRALEQALATPMP